MIEKLKPQTIEKDGGAFGIIVERKVATDEEMQEKINELVDAINTIQNEREAERFEIQEWISIIEAVRESVNTHKKEIDELQKQYENVCIWVGEQKLKTPAENVQDKFAEQRKWIGKICEFWDNDDTQQLSYGVLTKIDTESGFGVQYCCNDEYDYDNCQPVKPDDDIIYKGEQQ